MLHRGGSDLVGKVQGARPVGFLKQYLSWGMIKGQWSAKRQEGPSGETRRSSMDGWRWPVWLQCRDQGEALYELTPWRPGGPAQTPALTSRVSSLCYKQWGWVEGWWHDLICKLTEVGRPDHRNSQWQETNRSGRCCSDPEKRLWQFGPDQWWWKFVVRGYVWTGPGVSTVRRAVHARTLWIPNHNLWERCSSSHFIDENAEACSNLSKVQEETTEPKPTVI